VGGEIHRHRAQVDPQITALANGGFVMKWQDFGQGDGGYERLRGQGAGIRSGLQRDRAGCTEPQGRGSFDQRRRRR
jgi:hypothetical protein